MKWKKQIPDKEGIWLRQCAAKGHEEKHIVLKFIYKDGTEKLMTTWGWGDEQKLIDLADPKFKQKLEAFYWYGAIPLPPETNRLIVIKEG
ncbi:MAG: hypothetical protein IIC76_14020 [Bacteroidetes bacterium]|nr:hypothetical protein [Bacteroidota bacterium]